MDKKNVNQKKLIDITGYTGPAIKKITDGTSEPKFGFIEKILLYFDDVNPDWLLTGRGDMFIGPNQEPESEMIELYKFKIKTLEKDLKECQEDLFFNRKPDKRDA